MPQITEEQLRLLEKLVDAYWSDPDGGPKEDFEFWASLGRGPTIEHRSLEEEPLDVGDLRELEALGLVAIRWENDLSGRGRPTADGKSKVEEQRRIRQIVDADRAISGDRGPGVGWEETLPILQAIVDLYDQADPGEGVSQPQVCQRLGRNDSDSGVSRAFETLERSGYLVGEMEIDSLPGPLTAAPTEKALQLLSGWPSSGDAAAAKLLSILDERIAQAPSEEEKGKLRKLRDSVVDIGESITAEVLVQADGRLNGSSLFTCSSSPFSSNEQVEPLYRSKGEILAAPKPVTWRDGQGEKEKSRPAECRSGLGSGELSRAEPHLLSNESARISADATSQSHALAGCTRGNERPAARRLEVR